MYKPTATFKDAVLSALILALANMGDAFLYAYLPSSHQQIGISSFWLGVILSVNRYIRLFLNGWLAWVLTSMGTKTIVVIAILLASLTTVSYGYMNAVPLWIIARILWGISFSTLRLSSALFALEHQRKGMALGLSRTLIEFGPVIALIAGPFLLNYADRNLTFVVFGILSISGIFLVLPLSNLKNHNVSKKDVILTFPSSFNILVLINAFITEGVLVVLLIRLIQNEQVLHWANYLTLAGVLLGYKRWSLVLFSPFSGWLADKWGFHKVFIYTTILSVTGLLFMLFGATIAGIIAIFTFSAMNASTATGIAIVSEKSIIKDVSDNATWRDIGTATGAFSGALMISFADMEWVIVVLVMIYISGLLYHYTKSERKEGEKLRLFRRSIVIMMNNKKKISMKTEKIKVLEKVQFKEIKKDAMTTGCCGGTPITNEDACCKLDEEKKAEGEIGCGCNSTTNIKSVSGCC